jgi:hypothetical protein
LMPLAFAWQPALLSRSVLATLPELHPATAGATERPSAPAAKAQLASKAMRRRRAGFARTGVAERAAGAHVPACRCD